MSYCWEKDMKGVVFVYDLNPMDTLHNLIIKDDLNWLQRINVIHELAKLLEFLHGQEKQNLVLNISASHILLDKEDWYYYAEDGVAITVLGIQCIEVFPMNRPTMKDILQCLETLLVLQRLGDSRPTKRKRKFMSS